MSDNKKIENVKKTIENLQSSYDWEAVKELSMYHGSNLQEKLNTYIAPLNRFDRDELTSTLWKDLVEELHFVEKDVYVTKLGKSINSTAKIPSLKKSSWKMYENKLKSQNWSKSSINNIKNSSFQILQSLSMDTREDGPTKGLVIGNVQSGKTANMAGLMAMAADNGFNFFIVLSGVIESLREQTANRLYSDMNVSGNGNLHWHQIENPSLKSNLPAHDVSTLNLSVNSKDKYFLVSLKNKTRLKNLFNWLKSDENKASQMKILIIDDEADQASINTKNIEEDETAINGLIKEMVHHKDFLGMNYIAYTATPYANVLNEVGDESLYPKDFVTLLEPSEDYFGAKQIFGIEDPETVPSVDIVRYIENDERDSIRYAQKEESYMECTESLKKSVQWLMLSVAALRAKKYNKPVSMLVHTSFKINHHALISKIIEDYLRSIKGSEEALKQMRSLYISETKRFDKKDLFNALSDYSSKDKVADYPEWEEIESELKCLMDLQDSEYLSHIPIGDEGEAKYHTGIHLVIDNSRSKSEDQIMRLVYPNKNQMPEKAPAFIVVGGNTLSRGLTLEGLVSTYFLRTTNQADTLMQMARWFGYRKSYELFPRIWMDRLAYERYTFLAQMNEELKNEIMWYANNGMTPADFAPRIKNSPNYQLIRITSNNKMQSAKGIEFDFAGYNTQTIYFEKDKSILSHNKNLTRDFLNQLDKPLKNRSKMVWHKVSNKEVQSFLEKYKVCSLDKKMSKLPELLGWLEKNTETLTKWNVILSSSGEIERYSSETGGWDIHGYNPKPVTRTKLINRSTEEIVSIGALRSPRDLTADIEITREIEEEDKKAQGTAGILSIREKYGMGDVPQLIIYRVDKGELSEEEYREKHKESHQQRAPLNFPEEIIGLNILIPGKTRGGNLATYLSASINEITNDEDYIDEQEYKEDTDWN